MALENSDLRIGCAARVKALVDAIRSIPPELSPVKRASTQAIREQVYHGYEQPLARARGGVRLWGKYEHDRPWSIGAAELVRSGQAVKGRRMLERDHVWEATGIVRELMARPRTAEETAELLDAMLMTCTVLTDEHMRLGRVPRDLTGWKRYEHAGIAVVERLEV